MASRNPYWAKNLLIDKSGSKNGMWKGGEITRSDGYVLVRKGVVSRKSKGARYKLKHRIIMEEFLGRPLLRNEVVHHINGIKNDNRIENLELTNQSEHCRKHFIKLTEEQIIEIRKSNLLQKELSVIYNVNKRTISQIKNRHSWKHLF